MNSAPEGKTGHAELHEEVTGRPEQKTAGWEADVRTRAEGRPCTGVVSRHKRPAEEKAGQDAQLWCRQEPHCVTQGAETQQEGLFRDTGGFSLV